MPLEPISLTGDLLQFDRGGGYLMLADDDAVSLVRGNDRRTVHVGRQRVRAVAGFDDQIWVVEGGTLHRCDLDGRPLGEPFALPDAEIGAWSPVPCGPAGAVWHARPAVGIADDLGALAYHAHAEADLIVPVTARRAIAILGARVQMPSGITATLPPGARVLGGMVLGDGKSGVLAIGSADHCELISVSLGAETLGARHAISPGPIRVAVRRAIVAMVASQLEPNRIDIFDLRVGRELGSFVVDDEIDDLAIDPDGRWIAIRCGNTLEVIELAHRLIEARAVRARGTIPIPLSMFERAAPADEAEAPVDAPRTREAEPIAPVAREPARPRRLELSPALGPLIALAPRSTGPRLPREVALGCLEIERALILARARAGIAAAWDSRRLGYANESAHPFELEVAALVGGGRGHAETHVAQAQHELALAREVRATDRERSFEASPLADLAHDAGLGELELDILIAIAAPTLWGETARLYGVLANDPGRAVVDEMLVGQLLEATAGRYEIAAALGPDAALCRHGIVVASGERPRPFTSLMINPIVAARLRCEAIPLPDAVRIRDALVPLESLFVPVEPIGRIVGELARPHERPLRLVVRGRRGSGRRSLLAGLAARANRALGVIELAPLAGAHAAGELGGWLRAASLSGLVPCLVGSPTAEGAARPIADAIAMHAGPVFAVLGTDEPSPFPAGHLEVVLPPLGAGQRLDHWRRALGVHELRVADPELLSSRYRLAPGLVEQAVAQVARGAARDLETDVTPQLVTAIRQSRDERLARHATRIARLPRWSDVVLPPDVIDSLRELIGRIRHGRRVYEEWGFDAVMTTGRGLTALFDGRPGTGKTMVAGVVARELGLDLYRVDLSRLVSKWIGETEKNLAEIFDAVDDGQAIILFDEADSLFGKRTEVKSSNDRYANLEVNYLLQRIDTFDGIAILTTNFGSAIDPAFRRRVSLRLAFPFPDEEAREQLWRVHLPPQLPIDGELDLGGLARRFQLAGGYIRNACLRAAFLAAQEETTLAQRHLERAVHLEYQQVGKISTTGPVE